MNRTLHLFFGKKDSWCSLTLCFFSKKTQQTNFSVFEIHTMIEIPNLISLCRKQSGGEIPQASNLRPMEDIDKFMRHNISLEGECCSSKIKYGGVSIRGDRPEYEDRFLICPSHDDFVACIFDGHGGAGVAEYCYQNWIYMLKKQPVYETNPRLAMEQTFYDMERELFKHQIAGGTTVTCIIVRNNQIHVGHVGDSRAVLIRMEGFVHLTCDHRPYLKAEMDRITKHGLKIKSGRVISKDGSISLNMSRCLGDFQFKDHTSTIESQAVSCIPDILTYNLQTPVRVLLATDGLWDFMSSIEAVNHVKKEFMDDDFDNDVKYSNIVHSLMEKCLENPRANDNMTCMLIEICPRVET